MACRDAPAAAPARDADQLTTNRLPHSAAALGNSPSGLIVSSSEKQKIHTLMKPYRARFLTQFRIAHTHIQLTSFTKGAGLLHWSCESVPAAAASTMVPAHSFLPPLSHRSCAAAGRCCQHCRSNTVVESTIPTFHLFAQYNFNINTFLLPLPATENELHPFKNNLRDLRSIKARFCRPIDSHWRSGDKSREPLRDFAQSITFGPVIAYCVFMKTAQIVSATAAGTLTIGGDFTVNRMGYGAMRVTGAGIWGPPADRPAALATLRRAMELNVNLIDTADSYGPNVSEELIAEVLYPIRLD